MQGFRARLAMAGLPPALRRPVASPPKHPALARDVGFLLRHGVPYSTLLRACERATALGVSARQCLINSGNLTERRYAAALAVDAGVSLVAAALPDPRTDVAAAIRQGWCRARLETGREVLLVAATGPVMPAMLGGSGAAARGHIALTTEADYRAILLGAFSTHVAHDASASVPDIESARTGLTLSQKRMLSATGAVLTGLLLMWPTATLMLVPLLLGFLFLGAAVFQLAACFEGWRAEAPSVATGNTGLPRYSVLVPLHREDAIIDHLVTALGELDYPRERLQILLVVEQNDTLTQNAIRTVQLPPHIAMFVTPDGQPRTKPRALNAAMPFVTGEYVVVYDAEDRPDPLQLRKAVAAFAQLPRDVACLQGRLAIDNTFDSVLTRFFTIEYAALFDVTKAGCARLGLPVPLGGTSNHFRTSVLRKIGLWDAWNVTEDADLGFRIARHGYVVADLDSTTDEEAPQTPRAWMAQRTRWLKGWMQTIITHSRRPGQALAGMGWCNFLGAVSISAGSMIGLLFAPLFHVATVMRIASPGFLAGRGGLTIIADSLVVVLGLFGLLTIYVPAIIALRRRSLKDLGGWVALLPIYNLLISAAAWRALYELVKAPHRWNKTSHGHARSSRSAQKQ